MISIEALKTLEQIKANIDNKIIIKANTNTVNLIYINNRYVFYCCIGLY